MKSLDVVEIAANAALVSLLACLILMLASATAAVVTMFIQDIRNALK